MKKHLIYKKILLTSVVTLSLFSCNENKVISVTNLSITKDEKFLSATVNITIEEFNNIGFKLGDSCNIKFSNGYTIDDVPYFNGYYVKNSMPVIVAYPSSTNILITLNNTGIWDTANLTSDTTVDISLNTSAKYIETQEALSQSYSLIRSEYSSDEEFSNFRSLKGGNLKDNYLYRGASPVDNSRNRAKITDNLLNKNGIKYIVDLADNEDNMKEYMSSSSFDSTYAKELYENNKMILLSMGSGYSSDVYKQKLVTGLKGVISNNGSYYIHCMEGKDRTGFVCTLIEALAGATYEEMKNDYMETYKNYYKITKEKTPTKYDAIVSLYFDSFMEELHKTNDVEILKKADYTSDAKRYLTEGGMSETEINNLIKLISKD